MISREQASAIPRMAARLGSGTLGRRIIHRETVGSTQDILTDMADRAEDGTVLVARTQTGGRGRMGRVWASPPGTLTFSVLLRPRIVPDASGLVMLAASVSLLDAIRRHAVSRAAIKWPNDILVDGSKVAGLLVDASIQDTIRWMVVGVGVNVSSRPAEVASLLGGDATFRGAGSLVDYNPGVLGPDILASFLAGLDSHYSRMNRGDCGYLPSLYQRECSTIGLEVTIGDTSGTASGIDPDGALLVETASGRRRIISGDVAERRPPEAA